MECTVACLLLSIMSHPNPTIYIAGGSRGTPGPAGIGVYVLDQLGAAPYEHSAYLGEKTNNQAEYAGFMSSLEWLLSSPLLADTASVAWKLDSNLVVQQLKKNWKVKHPDLKPIVSHAWEMLDQLPCSYTIEHVRREHNQEADALVNQAIDAALA
jgi:ribonuclease HI